MLFNDVSKRSYPKNHDANQSSYFNCQKPETTIGEILKLVGVLILNTEFDFVSRRTSWSSVAPSKYVPDPCFGKTGIIRNRFDDI